VTLASINKPTILQLKGKLNNISAAAFLTLPFISADETARVRFNEVDKG
jgi:enoyl-CoA hydratase/carnithine racemase